MGLASCIDVNPYAHEDPPRLAAPLAMKNDKGIFCNKSGRLMTLDKSFESFACACCHFERRREAPHCRFELPMG